jgi:hypothetical protein
MISRLAEEGRVVSDGEFTMDRERARRKMNEFQLADPRAYVLELVQAAVLKGAKRIDFDIDADDLHMVHDGAPYTLQDFEELYQAAFAPRVDEGTGARQQLAYGLSAASRLKPRFIRVMSVDAEKWDEGVELLILHGKQEQYRSVQDISMRDRNEGPRVTTWVHVKSRLRLRVLSRFVENLMETLPEELLLRKWCCYAESKISLEGRALSFGLHLQDAVGEVEVWGKGIRGRAGFSAVDDRCQLHLVKDGVWITTHDLRGDEPGFVAVVQGKDLKKDISLGDVVRDEAYNDLRQHVEQAREKSLESSNIRRLRQESLGGKVGPVMDDIFGPVQDRYDRATTAAKYALWGGALLFPELGFAVGFLASQFLPKADFVGLLPFALLPYVLAGLVAGFAFVSREVLVHKTVRRVVDRLGRGNKERIMAKTIMARKAREQGDKSFASRLRQRLARIL